MELGTDKEKYEYKKISDWTAKWAKIRIEGDIARAMITSAGIDLFRTAHRIEGQEDFYMGMSALGALKNHLFSSEVHRKYILREE